MTDQEFEQILATISDSLSDDVHIILICLDQTKNGAYVGTSLEPDDAGHVLDQLREGLSKKIVTVKAH